MVPEFGVGGYSDSSLTLYYTGFTVRTVPLEFVDHTVSSVSIMYKLDFNFINCIRNVMNTPLPYIHSVQSLSSIHSIYKVRDLF